MGRSVRLVVVALVTALAVAACGGKEPAAEQTAAPGVSAPTVVDGSTLAAGEKIAAPTGEVVLTVTGAIGEHNKGKRLEFDLASLERMRRVRLEAAEPFLKCRVMFEGVLLSDLLLATKADGEDMPIDRSGPMRIVFPDSSSLGRNPDLWIWSVSSMKVA